MSQRPEPPPVSDWSASVVGLKRKLSRALRLGAGPTTEEVAEALLTEDREEKLSVLRRVMRETPRTPGNAPPTGLLTVAQEALERERDGHVLSYLVRVASHTGGAAVVRVLAPLLNHPDARVVSNTLESLALTADETVFTLALPLIGRDEPRIRATALAVMCKFDRTAALDAMVNYLRNSRDAQQRHGALFALRAVGGVPLSMVGALQREVDDPDVKDALARILEEAAPAGLSRLKVRVRHAVMQALTGERTGSVAAVLFPQRAVLPFLAAATLALAGLAWMTGGHPASAQDAAVPAARAGTTPRAVALAAPAAQLPRQVTWSGTVRASGRTQLLIEVDGFEVTVTGIEGMPRARPGDRVTVAVRVISRGEGGRIYARVLAMANDTRRPAGGGESLDPKLLRSLNPALQALLKDR